MNTARWHVPYAMVPKEQAGGARKGPTINVASPQCGHSSWHALVNSTCSADPRPSPSGNGTALFQKGVLDG